MENNGINLSVIKSDGTKEIADKIWIDLKNRLAKSAFRSKFHLAGKERAYAEAKGLLELRKHAEDFISVRIAPAFPPKDGKQTPMRGHPVFIAQHATGTCCRSCLQKWHGVRKGKELSITQREYIIAVIMRWIKDELK